MKRRIRQSTFILALLLIATFSRLGANSSAILGDGVELWDGAKTESVTEFTVPVLGGEIFSLERSYSSSNASQLGPFGYGWDISLPENYLMIIDTSKPDVVCDPRCYPPGVTPPCVWVEAKYHNVLLTANATPQPVTATPPVQCCQTGCVLGIMGDALCGGSLRAAYLKGSKGQIYRFISTLGDSGASGIFGSGHWATYYQSDPGPRTPLSCSGNPPTSEASYGLMVKLMENTDTGEMRLVNNDGTYEQFGNAPLRDPEHPSSFVGLSLLAMVDRNGNQTTIVRNPITSGGQSTLIQSPGGRTSEIDYDVNGLVTQIKDPMGRIFTYTYNALTELVEVDGPGPGSTSPNSGYRATFSYLPGHLMLSKDEAKSTGFKAARYDYSGNSVTAVYDGLGRKRYSYSYPSGGETDVSLGRGQVYHVALNNLGLATRVQLPDQTVILNSYDGQSNLLTRTVTPADGSPPRIWLMAYDDRNDLISKTDPLGATESWVYSSTMPSCGCDRFAQSYTDKDGNTTSYGHDSFGNLTISTDAAGYSTFNSFNSLGQRVSSTDARGKTTTFVYNAFGDLSTLQSPAGNVQYTYDALGRVTAMQDELGQTTSYMLDGFGNALTTTFADNSFINSQFDIHGNQTSSTLQTAQGQAAIGQISYTFDPADQLQQVTDAAGHSTSFTYDPDANRTVLTDPNNSQWLTGYDMENRVNMTSDPLGDTTTLVLDAYGNRKEVHDANGKVTQYQYDPMDRLRFMINANQGQIEFRYDSNGNKRFMIDANTHETEWRYDVRNLLTDEIDANTVTVKHYTYDPDSNVSTLTDGNGLVTTYAYDDANRLVSESPSRGSGYTYAYGSPTKLGLGYNLYQVTDPRGIETFGYDSLNRLVSQSMPGGEILASQYDARGNRLQTTLTFRGGVNVSPMTQKWTYDLANRNISATDFVGKTKTLVYDAASRLTAENLPGKTNVSYSYDAANRLLDLKNLDGNSSIISRSKYVLDRVGNRMSKQDLSGTISYSYDNLYQLTGIQNPATNYQTDATHHLVPGLTTTASVTYDPMGNRTSYSESYTGGLPIFSKSYNYDRANEMTNAGGIAQTFDKNGNLATSGSETLTWDGRNRLIGNQQLGKTAWSSVYDYNNRIAGRTVGLTQTVYVYDDFGRLLAELDGSGKPIALYSNDAIGLVGRVTLNASNGKWDPEYFLYDGLGSVITMVNIHGQVHGDFEYDAFGNALQPNTKEPFGYSGKWQGYTDSNLGKILDWNRWFAPFAGNWMSRDVIGTLGGANLYTYCLNENTLMVDPTGLRTKAACQEAALKAVAKVMNAAGTALNKGCAILLGNGHCDVEQMMSRVKAYNACRDYFWGVAHNAAKDLVGICDSDPDFDFSPFMTGTYHWPDPSHFGNLSLNYNTGHVTATSSDGGSVTYIYRVGNPVVPPSPPAHIILNYVPRM
jgi:RHS repeat-associated protein